MTDDDDAPAEHGLVMPFVVCEPDGPYDTASFVAGATFATIYADLKALASTRTGPLTAAQFEMYVPPALVPQLDLAAMECGFTLTATPWDEHPDEWSRAVFTRPTT